jgi:cyclic-di-GMP-binding protein
VNVDLIDKLHALVKPKGETLLDTAWLDDLPRDNYLIAQDIVLKRLRDFVDDNNPLNVQSFHSLVRIDERARLNVAALTKQYIAAPMLQYEIDERLWQSVYNYYHVLERAYQAFLDRYDGRLPDSPIANDLPQLLLNLVDCLRCAAKWRYLRYQSMSEGGWARLHRLYQLGESLGCTKTILKRYSESAETSLMSCYLQALMLDTLNHTSMLKVEIETLADWLSRWCEMLTLESSYSEERHLFFVALEEDRGGRRIRHFEPSPSYRYWDTDKVVLQVERLTQYARQNKMPADLTLPLSLGFSDCLLLTEHMLVEWSRHVYRRQRRIDERDEVAKVAEVVNGIVNVCQHVKNVLYSRGRPLQPDAVNARPLPESEIKPETRPEPGSIVLPGANGEKWTINNESKYGFGAVVSGELNLWLRPGRIIALDYELNPDMPVVGVVRSVKQLAGDKRHVGIEVLCHTPAYVRMRNLSQSIHPQDFLPTDIFLAACLATQGQPPFPALYLSRDDEKDIPSTLLLPRVEFIAGGIFELRTEHHHSQVRLGRVIEQKDDWVRVEIQLPESEIPLA